RPPGEIPSQPAGEPAANPPPAPAPDSGFRPGFVDAVGHWLNEGTTRFKSDLQGAQATFDQLGKETRDAAKGATDAVVGLPNARIVTVHERCAVRRTVPPIARRRPARPATAKDSRPAKASTPSRSTNARRRSCSRAACRMTRNARPRFS